MRTTRTLAGSATRTTVLALLLAAAGCSQYPVDVEVNRTEELTGLKSFRWAEADAEAEMPSEAAVECDRFIRRAVEDELKAKGYRPETTGGVDFLVAYRVMIEHRFEQRPRPSQRMYIRQQIYVGNSSQPNTWRDERYELGTITVEASRPGERRPFWVGSVSAKVHEAGCTAERRRRIDEAVGELMARFPAAAPSSE